MAEHTQVQKISRRSQALWRLIFSACLYAVLSLSVYAYTENSILVRVVVNKDSQYYKDFVTGLIETIKKRNYTNIEISFVNIDNDLLTISEDYRKAGKTINIGVGVDATLQLLSHEVEGDLISTMMPRVTLNQIRKKYPEKSKNIKSVFLDQPFDRQFALIRKLMPNASSVGVLFSEYTLFYKTELIRSAKKYNFELETIVVANDRKVGFQIKKLAKSVDAILATYDPIIMQPHHIKWLLYSAYQNRIPVFGHSQSFVEAGAMGAIYSEPVDIGIQAADLVDSIVSKDISDVTGYFPSDYHIKINEKIARALDINIQVLNN